MSRTVGILALQGAFEKHMHSLSSLGFQSRLIRKPAELESCDALIIPGGESTTISLLIHEYALFEPIKSFAISHPVMGVCAGMIMMASEVDDDRVIPLGLMPFRALRNFYGSQLHSFTADITLSFDIDNPFRALFIRAPGVDEISKNIEVLARYNNEIIMMRSGQHLALSFHPELTNDTRIHQYWLRNINQASR
jgi:5'-phosphate synthase pdxT subunit